MKTWTLVLPLLLVGCTGDPNQLGGDEWNAAPALEADQTAELDSDSAGGDPAVFCDSNKVDEDLKAEVIDGDVVINHKGVEAGSCAEWELAGENSATFEYTVTYTNTNEAGCDDSCYWEMNYFIPDAPSGTWTIKAHGQTATVEVP